MGDIERPDWGAPGNHPGGRETLPAVVEQGHEEQPTFSREDLALLDPGGGDLDTTVAESIKVGVFSREEAQAHYGYTDSELDRALAPPMSLASVQAELAKIDKLRRTDKNAYFKNEALQQHERDLITLREKLKAKTESASKDVGEYDGSGLDEGLLDEWSSAGGVQHHLRIAQQSAQAAFDALEPEEATALQESFDSQLPASAQTQIFRFLAVEPSGSWRPARDDVLKEFKQSDCAELLDEWGDRAARKLGVVRGRLNMMLRAMTPTDRSRAESWLDGLSTQQARAVFLALSGGR